MQKVREEPNSNCEYAGSHPLFESEKPIKKGSDWEGHVPNRWATT